MSESPDLTNENEKNYFLKQNPVLKARRGTYTAWKGNKYPEVKLRGFYSDVASQQNVEKTGVNTKLATCFAKNECKTNFNLKTY